MAYSTLKYTMYFRLGGDGWSESYYKAGSDISGAGVLGDIQTLCDKRQSILVPAAKLHHYRVSAVEEKRKSILRNRISPAGTWTTRGPRDYAGVGLYVDWQTAAGPHREQCLRGLPDSSVVYDDDGDELLGISATLQAYLDYIRDNGYLLRVLTQHAADLGLTPVTALDAAGNTLVLTAAGLTVSPGDVVLISNARGYKVKGIRGRWTVVSYSGAVLTLKSSREIDPNFALDTVPNIRVVVHNQSANYSMADISSWDNVRAGTRRVGRPSDSHRGRR